MSEESYVQGAPDGSGKKIRNVLLRGVPQPDGTYADVYVQCVEVLDADGRALTFEETNRLLRRQLEELRLIKTILAEAHDVFVPVLNPDGAV